MSVPFSTFHGTLRQITQESLTLEAEAVLRTCAPLFLALSDETRRHLFEDLVAREIARGTALRLSGVKVFVPPRRHRRFSGDLLPGLGDEYALPPGNYFSVCDTQEGQDYGTLVNELNAYRQTAVAPFRCEFLDCLNPEVAAALKRDPTPHILVCVPQLEAFLEALPTGAPTGLRESVRVMAGSQRPFLMTLGCRIVSAAIEGVLDLRQADAQKWFLERYVNSALRPTRVPNFLKCLPELLEPTLGGSTESNIRLQVIGADLRRLGLNALVYPSARTDVALEYSSAGSIRSRGWNLVKYDGLPPFEFMHDDNLGQWTTDFWSGITIREFHGDDGTYGWQVVGVEELRQHYYQQRTAALDN